MALETTTGPAQPALFEAVQRHFIEIEKNVISMGLFTPSSCRLFTDARKTTSTVRYIDGKRIETVASILPSAYYGLPVTADQDKYFALLKMIQDTRRRTGTVPNPVGFTSAALLRVLNLKKNGKNYDEVADWIKRMTATAIDATVFLAGRKAWVEDTFHVFDRAVLKGMELPGGKIATMNYVWLSSWQHENITANYLVPIDFDAYRQIRNHIAKALVPLLQVWLYSSMGTERFEKSYSDLCQLLAIRRYNHLSKIKGVMGPSLDELAKMGYISGWTLERRASGEDFKLSVTHGPKFFQDRELRAGRGRSEPPAQDEVIRQLVSRGVQEPAARRLLARIPDRQSVLEQLEWGDYLIRSARAGKFRNPAGFYVYLLRNGIQPPNEFKTSASCAAQQEMSARLPALSRLEDENAYAEYRHKCVSEAIRQKYSPDELAAELNRIKAEIRNHNPESSKWMPVRLEEIATQKLRVEVAARMDLPTIEEFLQRRERQLELFPPEG